MKSKQNLCFRKKLVKIKKNWVVVSLLGMILLSTTPLSAAASIQNMQIVHNQIELEEALKNGDINSIKLANDIDVDKNFINYQLPNRELSIDLDYHRLNSSDEQLSFTTTNKWGSDEKLAVDFKNKQSASNNKEGSVNNSLSSENISQSFNDVITSSEKTATSEHSNNGNTSSSAGSNSLSQSSVTSITSNQSSQSSIVNSVAQSTANNSNNVKSTSSSAPTSSNSDHHYSSASSSSYYMSSNNASSSSGIVQTSNSKTNTETNTDSTFYNDSLDRSASSQSANLIKSLLAQNTANSSKIINVTNQLAQLKNELKLKEKQLDVLEKSNANNRGLINVHPHRIKVDKKCYVYQEKTFNKKHRIRVANNKDFANQLVTQHAYSSEGRLRYKVSGGYITAHPDYVKSLPINK